MIQSQGNKKLIKLLWKTLRKAEDVSVFIQELDDKTVYGFIKDEMKHTEIVGEGRYTTTIFFLQVWSWILN